MAISEITFFSGFQPIQRELKQVSYSVGFFFDANSEMFLACEK